MRSSSAPGARRAPAAKGGESPSDMDRKFCPVCKAKRDVNKEKTVMTCCSRTVCAKCAERLHEKRAACPLCDVAFPRDDDETLARLVRAADAGDARAICHLGHAYANGALGVARSEDSAGKMLRKAADLGDLDAIVDYADHLVGTEDDPAGAAGYYAVAADRGDATAQFRLGDLYDNGDGVRHDKKLALKFYALAAAQGHTSAEYNVGSMYENGDGVASRDTDKARFWFERAAGKGHEKASALLGFLESQNIDETS